MNSIYQCKLLLVDDEKELLYLIEKILRREGFERIYLAGSQEEAYRCFQAVKPDCALLDVMLPDGDGFALMQLIRKTSEIPILFLTARGEAEDRILGLGLGADDYIVKPFLPKELTLRLLAVLKRVYVPRKDVPLHKPFFQLGNVLVDLGQGNIKKGEEVVSLTAKEYALLEKLFENQGRIVTYDSLCQAAWGDDYYGYENTLMVHIRRIREKLEWEPSNPQYLLTVRGLGYKLKKDENI